MIDVTGLSTRYAVCALTERDADAVLAIYRENGLFFRHCGARPTREQVLEDMTVTPPETARSAKHFVGFFRGGELIAVMDLIDGYPKTDIAYLGLFMLRAEEQGKQRGSAILSEAEAFLKAGGFRAIRLAINKGNPQSTHFWQKNGYVILREADRGKWGTLLEAEKAL